MDGSVESESGSGREERVSSGSVVVGVRVGVGWEWGSGSGSESGSGVGVGEWEWGSGSGSESGSPESSPKRDSQTVPRDSQKKPPKTTLIKRGSGAGRRNGARGAEAARGAYSRALSKLAKQSGAS